MNSTDIAGLLPAVFQQTLTKNGPLQALLNAMERQHAPAEEELARLHENFDPDRTRDAMLGFLATWLDLDRFQAPVGTQAPRLPDEGELLALRALIGRAAELSRWRGTAVGLVHCLELATGCRGFAIEPARDAQGGAPRPFEMIVRAPRAAEPDAPLIRRIIAQEKPAHVACKVEWISAADGPGRQDHEEEADDGDV